MEDRYNFCISNSRAGTVGARYRVCGSIQGSTSLQSQLSTGSRENRKVVSSLSLDMLESGLLLIKVK